jgi:hypothetical protein
VKNKSARSPPCIERKTIKYLLAKKKTEREEKLLLSTSQKTKLK